MDAVTSGAGAYTSAVPAGSDHFQPLSENGDLSACRLCSRNKHACAARAEISARGNGGCIVGGRGVALRCVEQGTSAGLCWSFGFVRAC